MIRGLAVLLLLPWSATSAVALELDLPANALETFSENTSPDAYVAPVGVFGEGGLPSLSVEGEVRRSAFRIATSGLTPLQILAPLRTQLEDSGYAIVLDCDATQCGGFDFRFATETLTAPAMTVNLRNYRFLTAVQGPENKPTAVVTLLASASPSAAHIQIIRAGDLGDTPDQFTRQGGRLQSSRPVARPGNTPDAPPAASGDLARDLIAFGRVPLNDLDFGIGDVGAASQSAESIKSLAAFLRDNPTARIALVGHTDNTGALDVNSAISLERANAVRTWLIDTHDIDPARIEPHGVGYLAPIRSNATEEGREANRRVEAVLIAE